MTWLVFAQLLLQYGLPFAEKMAQKWNNNAPVTQADIDELKVLGAQTPRTQLVDALARAGIAIDDPRAQALLALVTP